MKGTSRYLQQWLDVAAATPTGCRHSRGRRAQQPLCQKLCLLKTDMGRKRWEKASGAIKSGRDLAIAGQRAGKASRWEELRVGRQGDGLKGLRAALKQER